MIINDGSLALDDRVAEYWPSFDNERSGAITIEHLLIHHSGLPLTLLTNTAQFRDRVLPERNMHWADHTLGGLEREG